MELIKRVGRLIRWTLINGIFVASIVAGFHYENENALNLAMFMAWVTILASLLINTEAAIEALKTAKHSVPRSVDIGFDLLVVALFAYYGATVTAICYLLHILLVIIAREKAEKEPAQ